jgi:hypothetical protein
MANNEPAPANRSVQMYVNPLTFFPVDEPWAEILKQGVSADAILKFLCTPGDANTPMDIANRCKILGLEQPQLFAAPMETRILQRLIWPLRQAKGSYMLGHFLSTISLAGLVAEMAAILTFDVNETRIADQVFDGAKQQLLFGSSFKHLGQDRRVKALVALELIDPQTRADFDSIRTIRKRYLHLWSGDHGSLGNDAAQSFHSAVRVVVATLGLSVVDGKLLLKNSIFEYLRSHGIASDSDRQPVT